jgi:Xaa-Pro aminopeptidase
VALVDAKHTRPANAERAPTPVPTADAGRRLEVRAGTDRVDAGLRRHDQPTAPTRRGVLGDQPVPDRPPVSSPVCSGNSKVYTRWTLHSTSHMHGLDVHDCAAASNETYKHGPLKEGMVLTVEPGLYFKEDDLLVPEELRGTGIRIEHDLVVTADGSTNLSQALPREPAAIEEWMAALRA